MSYSQCFDIHTFRDINVNVSFQLSISTPDAFICADHGQCAVVISLFSQVEVGDIIRVNGSDFVPADAVILSSRYWSPSCLQTVL